MNAHAVHSGSSATSSLRGALRHPPLGRAWAVAAFTAAALLLAGCVGASRAAEPLVAGSEAAAAAAPKQLPAPADPAAPGRIVTPGDDLPNPFVLHEGDTYYLYASQRGIYGANIQLRSGPDLEHLGPVIEAMPQIPAWATPGFMWAPDVRRIGDRYVMWFTAGAKRSRPGVMEPMKCIGVAMSASPAGPFVSADPEPAICQRDRWGSIDPRTFRDADGRLWLHWKSDDNAEAKGDGHASIYAQPLAPDGRTLEGEAVRIVEADQEWEGRIVEAPQLVLAEGRYWLFYSANWFNQPMYGIGVAECDGPAGPCRKPWTTAWLGSNDQGAGPGESSLFQDERGWWIVYAPLAIRFEADTRRPVALAHVAFGPAGPYLAQP